MHNFELTRSNNLIKADNLIRAHQLPLFSYFDFYSPYSDNLLLQSLV